MLHLFRRLPPGCPRAGLAVVVAAVTLAIAPLAQSYVLYSTRWPQANPGDPITIGWAYQGYGHTATSILDADLKGNLSDAQIMDIMEEAFHTWAEHAPLHFVQFESLNTNYQSMPRIAIGQEVITSTDGNVLAHATYPSMLSNGNSLPRYTHFDNQDTWGLRNVSGLNGYDMLSTAIHEFGHNLGLMHSNVGTSIMAPYLRQDFSGLGTAFLFQDDIDAIQAAYGSTPGSVTSLWVKGDANRDGVVDSDDLMILADNWKQAQFGFSGGNFDYEGLVDEFDLAMLAANWGAGLDPAAVVSFDQAITSVTFAVPEPGSTAAFALGGFVLLCRRRVPRRGVSSGRVGGRG